MSKIILKREENYHCAGCGHNLNDKEKIIPYIKSDKIYCKKCYYQMYEDFKMGNKK